LGWKVEFDPRALAELKKLDRVAQKRVVKFFQDRIAEEPDARKLGRALTGEKAGFWRYRIGDYRAICFLDDNLKWVKVIRLAHRKEVYR